MALTMPVFLSCLSGSKATGDAFTLALEVSKLPIRQ